jgi:hypothetical protein
MVSFVTTCMSGIHQIRVATQDAACLHMCQPAFPVRPPSNARKQAKFRCHRAVLVRGLSWACLSTNALRRWGTDAVCSPAFAKLVVVWGKVVAGLIFRHIAVSLTRPH